MSDNVTKTNDIWRASLAVYLGYPLVEVEALFDRVMAYTVACPVCDWEIIESDYMNGRCALADAKEFVAAYNKIVKIQKEMRRHGDLVWTSSDWVEGKVA